MCIMRQAVGHLRGYLLMESLLVLLGCILLLSG